MSGWLMARQVKTCGHCGHVVIHSGDGHWLHTDLVQRCPDGWGGRLASVAQPTEPATVGGVR